MNYPIHEHLEQINTPDHRYTIHVGGTMDGTNTRDPVGYGNYHQAWENNIAVCLENIGDEPVENPWIIVNGKRDWRSLEAILAEILTDDMDEAEKARAIWEFARRHRYHFTPGDDEVKDTVKMLNVYGYTLCWDEAYTVSNLWQAAGLKIRRGIPHGHCTTEVFYDGAYHLLDSDEHLLILQRDNQTIASEAAIARDHDLMKRSHTYGILNQENRATSEAAASLFVHSGPHAGGRPRIGDHRMDLTLRPGEALVWEWAARDRYYRSKPPRWSNGRLCFTPRLDHTFARWATQTANLEPGPTGLVSSNPQATAALTYKIQSPYVIVGAGIEADTTTGTIVEYSLDKKTWTNAGPLSDPLILNDLGPEAKRPTYVLHLRLQGIGLSVNRLSITAELQMAPLSLPALEVGTNTVHYTDNTNGLRQIRLSHTWLERSDSLPPAAPSEPLSPRSGTQVAGTLIQFKWHPVDGAADYHFELSPQPDMRYCLSPVFEKLVSRTANQGTATWTVPEAGLLNPGQTYYWRVRARNTAGVWGPWSSVWNFIPQGPGAPLEVRLETDWENRRIQLHWIPNPWGQAPSTYEIYGSDERGFSAHREPYTLVAGTNLEPLAPSANLLQTTTATWCTVVDTDLTETTGNLPFFRVVAVDQHGVRSGPSDYAETPRPFVYSHPPQQIRAGQTSAYQLKTLASAGDLRSISDGPQRYISAFRDLDEPRFLLDEGPAWLELNETTGILQATPEAADISTHTVTIRVINGQGGTDVQGFDLEVVDEGIDLEVVK
jgi:hypothetical protein